jgi:hypothetical protein
MLYLHSRSVNTYVSVALVTVAAAGCILLASSTEVTGNVGTQTVLFVCPEEKE